METNSVLEKAIDVCLEHAARYNKEKLVVLDRDRIYFTVDGDDHGTDVDGPQNRFLWANKGKLILVHSHPHTHPTSLSPEDVMAATQFKMDTWAVTTDGGRYRTNGGIIPPYTEALSDKLNSLDALISFYVNVTAARVGLDRREMDIFHSHVFNKEFARLGYEHYEEVQGNELKKILQKVGADFAVL